jgi:hypothetical protein
MSNDLEEMGYVFLSTFDRAGRKNEEHSPEYKTLLSAIQCGDVKGFQAGGSKRWLVHKASADEFLERQAKPVRAEPSHAKQAEVSQVAGFSKTDMPCDLLEDISSKLSGLINVLGRIADAAESIATQPKPAQREFFSVTDTNSFHN